jgi:hypothetical protein
LSTNEATEKDKPSSLLKPVPREYRENCLQQSNSLANGKGEEIYTLTLEQVGKKTFVGSMQKTF